MKGIHHKRQTRHLHDLDSAIDRLMTCYFTTTKNVQTNPTRVNAEVLDELTIEVNNVRNVAGLASSNLTNSTEELVRMLVVKTTTHVLETLSFMFSSITVEERIDGTQFLAYTDKTQMTTHPDLAYFLLSLRSNDLLRCYHIKLNIMDGGAKVLAA